MAEPRRAAAAAELVVATLNLRNIADRWVERLPLLLADMAALQPDLLGLQECVFAVQQDRILAAAGEGRYSIHRGWAGRPEYGNAILAREILPTRDPERLDLGRNRSALRVTVGAPEGTSLGFAVTHLHHLPEDASVRDAQVGALLDWLIDADGPLVVVGDFNADPAEPAYRRMIEAGFRSAHVEANGAEPALTWPSGIVAPGSDDEGEPGCLDYVWLRGPLAVESCRLAFDRPAAGDPTLYPSDHFGLVARVRLG
ncbi:MAG TPA: endonuclease/exonuclease/phosphatase family protein [Candidatus Deferrimicrobiaceae bacterium]|nr:endonuclease/exonuclease/phosphatase family protein [Candidatus Deferrimicrobiaceae bacterium]